MDPNRRNKTIIFIAIGLFVGLILLFVYLFIMSKRIEVEIYVVPSDAQVTMDGEPVKAGLVRIPAGRHTFTATREYFETVTLEVNTDDLPDPKAVYLGLYPNSPEGEAYLAAHPEEQDRYEKISGAEFSALQDKLYSQHPITAELPYRTTDYKIDYDITIDQKIFYQVTLYPVATTPGTDLYKQQLQQYKAAALDWLKDNGVDPSNADIRFSPDPDNL